MKYLISIFLATICAAAAAQTTRNASRSIHDDDKILKLSYKMTSGDRYVDYENSFDVEGFTKAQKNTLVDHIIDSLNNAPSTQKKITGNKSITINDDGSTLTVIVDSKTAKHNIHYTKNYDVKGKNQKEKDDIVKKLLESLEVKD